MARLSLTNLNEVIVLNNNKNKENKVSFYAALITIAVCIAFVGGFYALNQTKEPSETKVAKKETIDESKKVSDNAGKAAITATSSPDTKATDAPSTSSPASTEEDNDTTSQAEETAPTTDPSESTENEEVATEDTAEVFNDANAASTFNAKDGLLWPVEGEVIMKYSMNNSIYFKTLAQYKCNPAIIISCEEGTEVKAAADGVVTSIDDNNETGLTVSTSIGTNYSLSYGQLTNLKVSVGDRISEGDSIGNIAKPSKYYSLEGSNLYFQVLENDNPVDPLLLLK